jgi:hypothetical protein
MQLLVIQEARAVSCCFRTVNLGALATVSGLRPAVAQLENRQRRFGLRLLSLPQGDPAREAVGAASAVGKRFKRALGYSGRLECTLWYLGRMETTVLLEEPEAFDADIVAAKTEAERPRPGLTCSRTGHD